MDPFQPDYIKKQQKIKNEVDKSMWTLSYRIKGMAFGLVAIVAYLYYYVGEYPIKMLVAGGILGYFLGWVVGSFFYTKK